MLEMKRGKVSMEHVAKGWWKRCGRSVGHEWRLRCWVDGGARNDVDCCW